MTDKATARPWRIEPNYIDNFDKRIIESYEIVVDDEEYQDAVVIARTPTEVGPSKANAELIVRAVNCHDELVEALRHILELSDENKKGIDGYELISEWASKAIAKAEGK